MKLSAIKTLLCGLVVALMCFAEMAAAQVATVAELTGFVQATPPIGGAASRTLRKGDTLNQGDTIATAAASSVVIRFADGQVAALSALSRLQISVYVYAPKEPAKNNVLISLLQGGMRSITGLIGRARPQAVSYRAASATIGIRGTDVNIVVDGGVVGVSVNDGEISFTFAGQTVTIPAGQAAVGSGSTIKSVPAAQLIAALIAQGANPNGPLIKALNDLAAPALESAVTKAVTTEPPKNQNQNQNQNSGTQQGKPNNNSGGGSASKG